MVKNVMGSAGSIVAGLCCLGFTPFLGALTAIGAGFLINDLILIPLFYLFLLLTLWGLKDGVKCHGEKRVLWLGLISSGIAFITIWFLPVAAYIGLAGVVAASIWDIYLRRICRVRERKV